ncbi:MAG: methyltransferase domain-containing protein [Leptospiraceae bacterium]|nr:methyltransferase domain-containing protein [Leptospiraceae bacterium]MDW7976072.1 methyltransferase domain-containing protein [Leptospiraceae bacterium]
MELLFLDSIKVRYAQEADAACCLSCGSPIEYSFLKPGEVLVDLGSGRGTDVIKATKYIGSSGKAIGIDATPEMISVAKRNAEKLRLKNVDFLLGEIENIPLGDEVADVVISNCVINHAKDKAKVYQEIYRILKPNGRFVISDIIAEKELPEEVKNDPESWAQCYGGAITKEEYFLAIAKANFKEIEILEESAPYEKGKERVLIRSITIRGYKK